MWYHHMSVLSKETPIVAAAKIKKHAAFLLSLTKVYDIPAIAGLFPGYLTVI
jgi:hypothetical protein